MTLYQQDNLDRRIKQAGDQGKLIEKELWLRWFQQLMLALKYIQSKVVEGKLAAHRDL